VVVGCIWANTCSLHASSWCLGGGVAYPSAQSIRDHILRLFWPTVCKALCDAACQCSHSAEMASAHMVRQPQEQLLLALTLTQDLDWIGPPAAVRHTAATWAHTGGTSILAYTGGTSAAAAAAAAAALLTPPHIFLCTFQSLVEHEGSSVQHGEQRGSATCDEVQHSCGVAACRWK
jgi:hypothetical protein